MDKEGMYLLDNNHINIINNNNNNNNNNNTCHILKGLDKGKGSDTGKDSDREQCLIRTIQNQIPTIASRNIISSIINNNSTNNNNYYSTFTNSSSCKRYRQTDNNTRPIATN